MGTLEQLLLLPGFLSSGQELGTCGSFFPAVCYSENELSGPGEHVGVFNFAVLGNAPSEAGLGSFVPCPTAAFQGS